MTVLSTVAIKNKNNNNKLERILKVVIYENSTLWYKWHFNFLDLKMADFQDFADSRLQKPC